jgi:tRNA A37 methylthiotransferase MiaB
MDVVGVFGYSDEDGTEAEGYDGKLDEDEIRERTEHVTRLVEELTSQRAEERIGEPVEVLLEDVAAGEGRAAHQGPEVDGTTTVTGLPSGAKAGDVVVAVVTGSDGADLVAEAVA